MVYGVILYEGLCVKWASPILKQMAHTQPSFVVTTFLIETVRLHAEHFRTGSGCIRRPSLFDKITKVGGYYVLA